MDSSTNISCDILVVGGGFSGSLAALCLHQQGFDVALVEKKQHPRFAVGESSTPIADMVLRSLAEKYDLPWLYHFSRYGSWQQHHPEIGCGIKRGFSYFKHQKNAPFSTNETHKNELLVAASVSNEQSDTNWFRADFDTFLAQKVQEYDIPYFDQTEITSAEYNQRWNIQVGDKSLQITCDFLVDATGNPNFAKQFLDVSSASRSFKTKSRALFSHFQNVQHWQKYLTESEISVADYPYNADRSAVHHLMHNGWMWMLRFNNEITSAGIVLDISGKNKVQEDLSATEEWESLLDLYPSLKTIFARAQWANQPGKIMKTGRLQRKLSKAAGPGWVALPHTAGFVDPLHSTGIAHTLTGLEKMLAIFESTREKPDEINQKLKKYEQSIFRELEMVDLLVAGCYKALPNFELFTAYTMLYFAAAIDYEQQRLGGNIPSHYLSAGNEKLQQIIGQSYKNICELGEIPSARQVQQFKRAIKKRIEPFNTAGLMDPQKQNMYYHTAAEL